MPIVDLHGDDEPTPAQTDEAVAALTPEERAALAAEAEIVALSAADLRVQHARMALGMARRTAVDLAGVEQISDGAWRAINAVLQRAMIDLLEAWPPEQ